MTEMTIDTRKSAVTCLALHVIGRIVKETRFEGLDWSDVEPMIERGILDALSNIHIEVKQECIDELAKVATELAK